MMIGICSPVSVLAALLRNAVRLFSYPISALNEVETFERLLGRMFLRSCLGLTETTIIVVLNLVLSAFNRRLSLDRAF